MHYPAGTRLHRQGDWPSLDVFVLTVHTSGNPKLNGGLRILGYTLACVSDYSDNEYIDADLLHFALAHAPTTIVTIPDIDIAARAHADRLAAALKAYCPCNEYGHICAEHRDHQRITRGTAPSGPYNPATTTGDHE